MLIAIISMVMIFTMMIVITTDNNYWNNDKGTEINNIIRDAATGLGSFGCHEQYSTVFYLLKIGCVERWRQGFKCDTSYKSATHLLCSFIWQSLTSHSDEECYKYCSWCLLWAWRKVALPETDLLKLEKQTDRHVISNVKIHSWQKRLLHPGMMCLFCDYFYFISPRGLRTGCLV